MDLKQHLLRQMAWSHATFGPGERMRGIIDHLGKELGEIEDSNGSADEWVDAVILALDGLTRRLAFLNENTRLDPERAADVAIEMILSKQAINEARVWPDWRSAEPDKAIEHSRDHD